MVNFSIYKIRCPKCNNTGHTPFKKSKLTNTYWCKKCNANYPNYSYLIILRSQEEIKKISKNKAHAHKKAVQIYHATKNKMPRMW